MNFSLLTYNTLFNKAYEQIGQIIKQASPDIICLQEVDISVKNLEAVTKFGYKLADYSGTFIKFGKGFGVVTYYNPKKLKLVDTHSLKIGFNLLELFFAIPQLILGINKPKSILRTDFICKASGEKIIICNSHLIVIASNTVRIRHINQALNSFKISLKVPLVIAGDFNYLPYHRRKLDNVMKKYDLVEATKNIRQTVDFSPKGKKEKFSFLQGFFIRKINHFFGNQMKNDYIYYRGVKLVKTDRLEVRFSDHYPIISTFNI
jgi:endonuclease/exonuclease/phosphatase family metal-dependent hydrolase